MHKITKGLKKKKKGKKSKHKEDDLFKPEELEAYRRERQSEESGAPAGQNEEWKKFLALTSGVDDILKKTQGDLDRIKSTSFFQRIPTPSQVKQQEEANSVEEVCKEEEKPVDIGIVPVSESESEEEEDDDIFDTTYIDAIAAGEVKLAYIPESPTEDAGEDPFDTSYAERAILGPVVERKGKKLVPLGAAVDVLTGRVQIPTCATVRPASRRQVLKQRDLLLGSFDDNANSVQSGSPEEIPKTLLDEDTPLPDEPIDLSKNLHQITAVTPIEVEDEDDEEFAALAAESLSKAPVANAVPVVLNNLPEENWAAFSEEKTNADPFDTAFAENILPSKTELKIIENEILKDFTQVIHKVSIKVTDPAGQRESISSLDRVSEAELNLITPIHRDLLGGSNTDLSNLSNQPLKPAEKIDDNYIEYSDPFDTSIVETANVPGQTELKFLEKEFLGDIKSESEDEFDPRAGEPERTLSRPDVLNLTTKTVSFDLPSPPSDLLGVGEDQSTKKPLTPFYVRKNSVPEEVIEEDPFDTSFASDIAPGKAELKQIESELFDPLVERNLSIEDPHFDPRDEKKAQIEQVVQSIKDIACNKKVEERIDLLNVEDNVPVKVLTPTSESLDEISYTDPFDTSIATNIFPGKTELKLLETELIHSEFHPVEDLLDNSGDIGIHKPLNPLVTNSLDLCEDIDPFDTSIANNIAPGRTELKLLESELI